MWTYIWCQLSSCKLYKVTILKYISSFVQPADTSKVHNCIPDEHYVQTLLAVRILFVSCLSLFLFLGACVTDTDCESRERERGPVYVVMINWLTITVLTLSPICVNHTFGWTICYGILFWVFHLYDLGETKVKLGWWLSVTVSRCFKDWINYKFTLLHFFEKQMAIDLWLLI